MSGKHVSLAYRFLAPALFTGLTLLLCRGASAAKVAVRMGSGAGDFPPGTFSDGGNYSLEDFRDKLVVLFFYEKECPTCRGLIPKRNEVVEQFRGKPVVFIAVGPNDTLADVRAYQKETKLEMLSYPDTLGAMEAHYGFHISLQNIYQFRYIVNGQVVNAGDFTVENVNSALKNVQWKYKDGGYDARLNSIIEQLDWNQYVPALRQLRPLVKSKTSAEYAGKLYTAVTAEGQEWLDQAETSREKSPAEAFDLYTKVSIIFQGEDLGKKADAALKDLRKNKSVQDELAARALYQQLYPAMSRATARERNEVVGFCDSIATKYPETPTGKKAAALSIDLQRAAKNVQG